MTSPLTPVPDDDGLPDDPDVDMSRPSTPAILAAVTAGGVLGALARYQIGRSWPVPPAGFPWSTFVINVSGCLLIGALLVVITERFTAHPLLRPFLATGILGGYTTFSTYTVDLHRLLGDGRPGIAVAYLLGTVVTAVAATALGMAVGRRVGRA